jgi:hypothetical protein
MDKLRQAKEEAEELFATRQPAAATANGHVMLPAGI